MATNTVVTAATLRDGLSRPRDRQAAIVGIDVYGYAKDLGVTERYAGSKAMLGALADAGLTVDDVDGIVRYLWEKTTEAEYARILGVKNLRMFGCVDYGGGAGGPVIAQAAMAIEKGICDVVLVMRARNRGSGVRPWVQGLPAEGQDQFERPHGIVRPVEGLAFTTRLWMQRFGWTREDLGLVAVTQREHARRNPQALMQKPMTIDDYMAARWIAEPFCLFDCCLETDAALALVMTTAERARDLDVTPAYVAGYAYGSGPDIYAMTNFYGDTLGVTPGSYIAPELWANTGLSPTDIDVCQIYDAFTPQIPLTFQEYGFCGPGEEFDYIRSGEAPLYNTSGGGLSEAYTHGLNTILEGVRQIRGTSTTQVDDARTCLVTAGNVVPTGSFVLAKDPWE
jgi:acetyl-CoA acetyltransferase